MNRPTTALVLALVSFLLCPGLLFIEMTALLFSDLVINEPSNSGLVKALTVVMVIAIACVAIALPVVSLVVGARARSAAKVSQASGADVALAALVIAGFVMAGVVAFQVYLLLMVFGACSLEGC
ncbi:MAG: hypothetical protein KGN78_06360 [Actinomycetales bacterium]|nr:hypothetical protein [Actinomycetales bacterium]